MQIQSTALELSRSYQDGMILRSKRQVPHREWPKKVRKVSSPFKPLNPFTPTLQGIGVTLSGLVTSYLGSSKDVLNLSSCNKTMRTQTLSKAFIRNETLVNDLLTSYQGNIQVMPDSIKSCLTNDCATTTKRLTFFNAAYMNHERVKELVRHFPHLTELTFHRCLCFCGNSLRELTLLSSLKKLNLTSCSRIDAASFEYLEAMTSLQDLTLANTQFNNDSMRALHGMGELASLDLSGTYVISDGFSQLIPLAHLQTLRLQNTRIDNEALQNIFQVKSLKNLTLSLHQPLSLQVFDTIEIKSLTSLCIDGQIPDGAMKRLSSLTSLERLNFGYLKYIPSEEWAELQQFPNLKDLTLPSTIRDQQFRECIFPLKNLKRLYLVPLPRYANLQEIVKNETILEFAKQYPQIELE